MYLLYAVLKVCQAAISNLTNPTVFVGFAALGKPDKKGHICQVCCALPRAEQPRHEVEETNHDHGSPEQTF